MALMTKARAQLGIPTKKDKGAAQAADDAALETPVEAEAKTEGEEEPEKKLNWWQRNRHQLSRG